MNIQELIKKYEEKHETVFGFPVIQLNQILEDLKQLDEPQKPTVPRCVADWYEENKDNLDYNIWDYVCEWEDQKKDGFKNWFDHSNKAFQTIVNMHQFGYEIKKEKRYIVKFKNVQKNSEYLKYDLVIEKWYFGMNQYFTSSRLYHTKEELEKGGFEWLFSCEGVEIEEVEE